MKYLLSYGAAFSTQPPVAPALALTLTHSTDKKCVPESDHHHTTLLSQIYAMADPDTLIKAKIHYYCREKQFHAMQYAAVEGMKRFR